MSRWKRKLYVGATALTVTLGWLGMHSVADQGDSPKKSDPAPSVDLAKAKEIAALIGRGQLKLQDAGQLAERYAKGVPIDIRCEIEPAAPLTVRSGATAEPPQVQPPLQPRPEPSAERRLIYHVSCFAQDKIQIVRVDGLGKKVIDAFERKETNGGPPKP